MNILENPILTQDLEKDICCYLGNEYTHVAQHSIEVANCAVQLAERFEVDRQAVKQAGLLHDISVKIPNLTKVSLAEELGIDLCPAEYQVPMLIHQKLSKYMAAELFQIKDKAVLSAIECHTTLKQHPSRMDYVVFLADKIKWDQGGTPPYLSELLVALDRSLEAASLVYINYLLAHDILVIHPWLAEAQLELSTR